MQKPAGCILVLMLILLGGPAFAQAGDSSGVKDAIGSAAHQILVASELQMAFQFQQKFRVKHSYLAGEVLKDKSLAAYVLEFPFEVASLSAMGQAMGRYVYRTVENQGDDVALYQNLKMGIEVRASAQVDSGMGVLVVDFFSPSSDTSKVRRRQLDFLQALQKGLTPGVLQEVQREDAKTRQTSSGVFRTPLYLGFQIAMTSSQMVDQLLKAFADFPGFSPLIAHRNFQKDNPLPSSGDLRPVAIAEAMTTGGETRLGGWNRLHPKEISHSEYREQSLKFLKKGYAQVSKVGLDRQGFTGFLQGVDGIQGQQPLFLDPENGLSLWAADPKEQKKASPAGTVLLLLELVISDQSSKVEALSQADVFLNAMRDGHSLGSKVRVLNDSIKTFQTLNRALRTLQVPFLVPVGKSGDKGVEELLSWVESFGLSQRALALDSIPSIVAGSKCGLN